jgi:hypothetical protein
MFVFIDIICNSKCKFSFTAQDKTHNLNCPTLFYKSKNALDKKVSN